MSNGFTVPYSSSPSSEQPSTPPGGRYGWSNPSGNPFSFNSTTGLSTTPAGPPPSSAGSFTPAGPPPSSFFGSSQPRGQSLFGSSAPLNESTVKSPKSPGKKGRSPKKSPKKSTNFFDSLSAGNETGQNAQNSPQRSMGQRSLNDDDLSEDDDDYVPDTSGSEDDSDEDYEDEDSADSHVEDTNESASEEEEEEHNEHDLTSPMPSTTKAYSQRGSTMLSTAPHKSTSMRGVKRSHSGHAVSQSALYKPETHSAKKSTSAVSAIAKNTADQLGPAELEEPDDLILNTEDYITRCYPDTYQSRDAEELVGAALRIVPQALSESWSRCCLRGRSVPAIEQEFTSEIGPGDDAPSFHKAAFVAELLFKLYHPPLARGKQAFAESQLIRSKVASHFPVETARQEAYPKVLLNWLDANHNPYREALAGLKSHQPNPTAHANFWDILYSAALRGNISYVIHVLNHADFTYARTAGGDGQSQYSKIQLQNVQKVIQKLVDVLQECPGVKDDDWYVDGIDWSLFRRRVDAAHQELLLFAESRAQNEEPKNSSFEASNFGLMSTTSDLSQSTRRAESKVPWTIFQNLKVLYGLLLGGTVEILSVAQDWLEATVALAVWWDGDETDEEMSDVLLTSKNTYSRAGARSTRLVDMNPGVAYRKRLGAALERATNESLDDALQINTNNHVELAIAAIFEDNIEGVLSLLQAWSVPIAAAVVEVASQAGWYESAPGVMQTGFNESDLMVLSYGRNTTSLNKDGILNNYAELLFARETLQQTDHRKPREGWELAVQVLGRLDDTSFSSTRIGSLLSQLSIENDHRADKIIDLCRAFGLDEEACRIAENYATKIAETTTKYGTALIYYARSHIAERIIDVLDLLISYCLVQSRSFPPAESLDPHLRSFLASPRESLSWLGDIDPEASNLLSIHMSGYATLRKFYDTRDDTSLRLTARKRAAATPLLAVIGSAADRIQGGLYDQSNTAVVPVEGLLVLLGEVMVLVDQPTRILSIQQILLLLRSIEDLETVHSRIRSQCAECLSTTLASAHGVAPVADPRELLRKSVSDLTTSSAFSLIGSSLLDGAEGKEPHGSKRGWDWRKGLHEGAGAKEIISSLRIGLARDISRAWL